jgi:segregation and condensation protein B
VGEPASTEVASAEISVVERAAVEPASAEISVVEPAVVEPAATEVSAAEPVSAELATGSVDEPLDHSATEPLAGLVAEPVGQFAAGSESGSVDEPLSHSATAPESGSATEPLEAPADADEGIEDGVLPLSDADLESALEALLLVVDAPVEEEALATAVNTTPLRVAEHLRLLSDKYTDHDRGIDLRRVGGGWRFYTRDRYAPYVEKLLLDGQRAKLTRAALETLAVIAYRQPVTRARVAAVRGVNCDGVIRTLLARGLVEETGTDVETGGYLYRTTELFLERIGLSSLDDLPPIAPLLPEVDSIDEL